ncbi:ThuA domain-containing protein [Streptomyces sp. N2-109]|uniref:ThuA domain-containing protein n=1 Tax=Streptomyces gossypii TaxID=2883101 RepID=A0ABT2JZX4_9ACTN|nr:ThuA domain-containing protein [Streptomyces gossypii]MCT2593467.1 ThuA domain-containing protein [Streptomyces gossypii]
MRRRRYVLALTATVIGSLMAGVPSAAGADDDGGDSGQQAQALKQARKKAPGTADPRVLVFHGPDAPGEVTEAGIAAITEIGSEAPAGEGFRTEVTDDPGTFTPDQLRSFNAVVFLSAGGDLLNAGQEAAFTEYIRSGGGFLGVHDAARAEPDSSWFTGLLGARPADGGPDGAQEAVVEVGDRVHPATSGLPLEWERDDVWFNWTDNPSGKVHTVARVRESTYEPGAGANGWDHPVSWCRDYDGGRSFYTGMGGTVAGFGEDDFRQHLHGALLWTTRLARADCQATISANYDAQRVTQPNQPGELDQIGEPHGMDIAEDGRVFSIGRAGGMPGSPVVTDWDDPRIGLGEGTVHIWDPETEQSHLAGTLDVFGDKGSGGELTKTEEGLLGIALAPDFADSGWIYLHWTPHSKIDRSAHTAERRVSRFTLDPDSDKLDPASEKVLLSWPVQIHSCCHAGGGMDWDSKGNLYIATGDTNSSGFSGGYSGNNPEPVFRGLSFADARRTSGNTNNLNGKILRIHPEPDGSYTVPEGNLFTGEEEGGGKTRAEIYVMGVRNPSRIAVDKETDKLYAGWVGPDAGQPSTTWGPAKYETFAVITSAGNQGWPYCMGNRQPYRDRNLPDPDQPLGWYDCDNLKNESPHNDGLVNIPPARDNNLWYSPQGGAPDFPRNDAGVPSYRLDEQQLLLPWLKGGVQAAMTGPVYRYDEDSQSDGKWPAYWDGKWFAGDHYDSDQPRHALLFDPASEASGGLPVHAESLDAIIPPGNDGIRNLMGWKFGPDGSLYVQDYGRGFFNADEKSALWRVTYEGGPPTPTGRDFLGGKR